MAQAEAMRALAQMVERWIDLTGAAGRAS